jgi:hypothetical protein
MQELNNWIGYLNNLLRLVKVHAIIPIGANVQQTPTIPFDYVQLNVKTLQKHESVTVGPIARGESP